MLWKTAALISGFAAALGPVWAQQPPAAAVDPSSMPQVGTIDERFQSYNIEMIEVIGGKFWRPYRSEVKALPETNSSAQAGKSDTPLSMDPELYENRPPIDLGNKRLRILAAALGPAYLRVSGTWANTTYFAEFDHAPATPPPGFKGVLTHQQWKGVIDFARAVDAKIVTSFATSPGTRDASGLWNPDRALRLIEYTSSVGGSIAAAEFMNEPTLAAMGGAPPGYDALAYGRDFQSFRNFARQAAPGMLILGPGSVGERSGGNELASGAGVLKTRDMLLASGPGVDRFSYHHYGALSFRCRAMDNQTTAAAALSEEWLARTDATLAFYRRLRDEFEPGKPLWVTETADAACGGNPWASTFRDTFRYLDQLGRLARQKVEVVAHNTLTASDYGLLEEHSFAPKPNYWGALLWRKLVGARVLDAGVPSPAGIHLYAHCLRNVAGGVVLLAINTDSSRTHSINIGAPSERYTLSGELDSITPKLNGAELTLLPNDELPLLTGVAMSPGLITFAPASITFLAIPQANNSACS
jgi:hypothetical protein